MQIRPDFTKKQLVQINLAMEAVSALIEHSPHRWPEFNRETIDEIQRELNAYFDFLDTQGTLI